MNISAGAPYNAAGAIGRVTGTTYLTGTLIARAGAQNRRQIRVPEMRTRTC